MSSCKILDCTLRDGGYINQWKFNDHDIVSIVGALAESNVDLIECGYLSATRGVKSNSTLFQNIERIDALLGEFSGDHARPNFVVMINQGEFDPINMPDYHAENSVVQGVRLTFKKDQQVGAVETAKKIVDKGYNIFIQPMAIQAYSDDEVIAMIRLFLEVDVYAMYVVDSFGSLFPESFRHYCSIFDSALPGKIVLGYHAHNNLQLAYANAISFVEEFDREIIIDSSIFGMGRGAGNLNTELVADYLNRLHSAAYKIDPMLEIIDSYLDAIFNENKWGYSVAHFLSAVEGCHPSYSSYYTNKKSMTVRSIRRILDSIDPEYRNSFSQDYAEEKYLAYNAAVPFVENIDGLDFKNKKVLLIASGPSVNKCQSDIVDVVEKTDSQVIAVNHIPEFIGADYYFFSNQKRYAEFGVELNVDKLIVTSNIDLLPIHIGCYLVGFERLVNLTSNKCDNVAILLLNLLYDRNGKSVMLAGLDGYDSQSVYNYSYNEYGRPLDSHQMEAQNKEIGLALKEISGNFYLHFVTPSIFESELDTNILGVIPARYHSTRFPGKPLVSINGIPMLQRTYNQACKCKALNHLVVATDDERIRSFCENNQIPVVMTSSECLTGTDRLAEVATQLDAGLYINIQGDEPVVDPLAIDKVVDEYQKFGNKYVAYNLYKYMDAQEDPGVNTLIKVVVNKDDELMYMSRLPVPYDKAQESNSVFKKQVCIYGFTKQALMLFSSSKKTLNERHEDIEILRFVDMGYKVKMSQVELSSIAVDVPDDIKKVESYLSENGIE